MTSSYKLLEDLTRFMIQHAYDFNATVAKTLRFDIEPF